MKRGPGLTIRVCDKAINLFRDRPPPWPPIDITELSESGGGPLGSLARAHSGPGAGKRVLYQSCRACARREQG